MFVGSCPNRHRRIRHGVYDNIDAPGGASDDQGVQRRRLATELGMPELRTDKVVMTAMAHPLRTRERPLTIYNAPCAKWEGIHQGSCRQHFWSTVFVTISLAVSCFAFAVAVVLSVVGQ